MAPDKGVRPQAPFDSSKQPPLAEQLPNVQTGWPRAAELEHCYDQHPHPELACWPDKPLLGSLHPRGTLDSGGITQVFPYFQGPLRVFSALTAAQGTPYPTAALPGCEGLPDASSSFPTLVSVTRSTFCPEIRFLGFCLFSGLGVFEGDSLLPELKCSGLTG